MTNAHVHGRGSIIALRLIARNGEANFEAMDGGGALPVARIAADDEESGRGLFIVKTLSTRWGVRDTPGGKGVWATVSLPEQPRDYRRRELLLRLFPVPRSGRSADFIVR